MNEKKMQRRITELEGALKGVQAEHYGEVTEAYPLGSICHECSTPRKIVRWPCEVYVQIDKVLKPADTLFVQDHDEAKQ